jgi:hypothetical protein
MAARVSLFFPPAYCGTWRHIHSDEGYNVCFLRAARANYFLPDKTPRLLALGASRLPENIPPIFILIVILLLIIKLFYLTALSLNVKPV